MLRLAEIDLHVHSTCSDGSLSPEALVRRAVSRGVQVLALTDHDTVCGVAEAKAAADEQGIQLIAGIELSTVCNQQPVHILGLNLQLNHPQLQELVQYQCVLREQRGVMIADRLEALGFLGVYAEAVALASAATQVGRLHFAQVLVQRGIVTHVQQAFDRYLKDGKKASVPFAWVDMEHGIQALSAAGGSVVLAHPLRYKLGTNRLRCLLQQFRAAGGDGVELATAYEDHNMDSWLRQESLNLGLCGSQGSDFHGSNMPWIEVGACFPLHPQVEPLWQRWQEAGVF